MFALVAALASPHTVLAHPLGNFTINHYAAIRVAPTEISLDVVLDRAEIPAFQERIRLDVDGDGAISAAEADAARSPECTELAAGLELLVNGTRAELELTAAGLTFPPGSGGLATMRLVCAFRAPIPALEPGTMIGFADQSFADRLGWREIVVYTDGTTLDAGYDAVPTQDVSARLTAYPEAGLAQPLDVREVTFAASPGGPALEPFTARDAQPVDPGATASPPTLPLSPGAVPGGIGADLPAVFVADELSPGVLAVALLSALALGAGHALTPGHGKTLMAAYLIGRRGTAVHAAALGLSVSVSHTLGILVLAAVVVAAGAALPAEVVVRWLPALAALGIVAIGLWMLVSEVHRRPRRTPAAARQQHEHDSVGHEEPHEHDHAATAGDAVHEHGGVTHAHGGVRHSHLPSDRGSITWRSLFALGLAGGIVPSTSALLILLATIAAGRPVYGLVLVVAFGVGMAVVMSGIGLALVLFRGRLEHLGVWSRFRPASSWAPLVAACVVLALGVWLTSQAVLGQPTF